MNKNSHIIDLFMAHLKFVELPKKFYNIHLLNRTYHTNLSKITMINIVDSTNIYIIF